MTVKRDLEIQRTLGHIGDLTDMMYFNFQDELDDNYGTDELEVCNLVQDSKVREYIEIMNTCTYSDDDGNKDEKRFYDTWDLLFDYIENKYCQ